MTDIYALGIALLAIIGGLIGFGTKQRRKGRKDQQNEDAADAHRRVQKGTDRVAGNRDRDADQRLRDNDQHWQ